MHFPNKATVSHAINPRAWQANCLRFLPSILTALVKLAVLDASYNQISALPPAVGVMTWLHRLSLKGNFITELPTSLHLMLRGNINTLDVSDNGLKSPPPEVVAHGKP